jgi:acyl carrier protein
LDALTQLVAEVLEDEGAALGEDAAFAECAMWDSLKHVELVVGIERRFAIDLSPGEIAQLTCKRAARAILAARGVR